MMSPQHKEHAMCAEVTSTAETNSFWRFHQLACAVLLCFCLNISTVFSTATEEILLSYSLSEVNVLPYNEFTALYDLYVSTRGNEWRGTNSNEQMIGANASAWHFPPRLKNGTWLTPLPNPCAENWQGVICSCSASGNKTEFLPGSYYYDYALVVANNSAPCNVVKLYLGFSNLHGSIPSSIGYLIHLTHLHLGANAITGKQSIVIGYLIVLENRVIFTCFFVVVQFVFALGPIPTHLSALVILTRLELASNILTGTTYLYCTIVFV